MAVFKISFMTLALFVVAGILFSGNNAVSGQDCKGDFGNLAGQCLAFVQRSGPKIPPSKECCDAIKMVDVPCGCKYLPDIFPTDKVAYVLQVCGQPLAPGTKCGSGTVPPAV